MSIYIYIYILLFNIIEMEFGCVERRTGRNSTTTASSRWNSIEV